MVTDLAETEEGIVLATVHADNQTSVPDKNKFENCLSCNSIIKDIYCGNCGQKNDDLRRSLWRLIAESLGGIFSFEGRMWRTWGALLFKPGKVAREYANGARTLYSSPIRVYLVVSFIFFGFMALTQTNLIAVSINPKTDAAKSIQSLEKSAIDLNNITLMDHFNFDVLFFQSQKVFEKSFNKNTTNAFLDVLKKDSDLGAASSDTSGIDPFKSIQVFLENPKQFNAAFNTWLPRVMFFMVPIAMILGKMFIRGPTALLYDHLIHAMYIHAVFFMSLLLAILLSKVLPGGLIARTLIIIFMIFLPMSLKCMFNRGWVKTIFTTVFVSVTYSVLLFSAIVSISVYAVANLST